MDIASVPREWLFCRGYAHGWDPGVAPIQVAETQPVTWITQGRCVNCSMRRWLYLVPVTCVRISKGWEYADPAGFLRAMRLITKQECVVELSRRDRVGADEVGAKRRAKTG